MTELVLERPQAAERAWILGWWAAGRALVFVTAAVIGAVGPRGYTHPAVSAHPLGLLTAWDGRWYRTVAQNGYLLEPGRQSDPAFFPLFPLLMRLGHAFGVSYAVAGVLFSNAAFVVALYLFHTLTRTLFDETVARRATMLLAVFPLGFVFSMAYPESFVLALACGAALAAYRDRWWITAVLLAGGALARPETLFIALALAPLAWRRRDGVALGAIAAPFAALGSFALYLWRVLGDPLAWTHAERAWGRQFQPLGLVHAIDSLPQGFAGNPGVVRDVACLVVYLAAIWVGARRGVPSAWALSGVLVVILPTFSGSFHSLGRFGLLAPAVIWGISLAVRGRWLYPLSGALLVASVATLPLLFP